VEVDSIPQQTLEESQQIERADLVVAILAELDGDGIATVHKALRTLSGSLRIAAMSTNSAATPSRPDPGSPEMGSRLAVVPWPTSGSDVSDSPMKSISARYQAIFEAGERLEARGCCIIASNLENGPPNWIGQFLQPLLEADVDLVTPNYARHKLEGLLNSSILCPLTRSLYGKQIQNPMGPDLVVSRKLFQRILRAQTTGISGRRIHPLASLASIALCDNLRVCQVHLGARIYSPTDWMNISSLLVEVLGPVFLDIERNAACWQRIRESIPLPGFGKPFPASQQAGAVDVGRLVNSFQLGTRDLQEIWSLVLPPATLLELRKLSRLTQEQFHMPDELWVRIVFDFALAHRLRTINRDHLLRSMTPLYLGWVASHAWELKTADASAVEQRLERLSRAYEAGKSYLVSRWRWPDRFNP